MSRGLAWTNTELEILHSYYPIRGEKGMAKLLPNRSPEAIGVKANRLGLWLGVKEGVHKPMMCVCQAGVELNINRETIMRLAKRDNVSQRCGQKILVPEAWVKKIRLEYPHGGKAVMRSIGYVSAKNAASIIGVAAETLHASIRGEKTYFSDTLAGIKQYKAGHVTYFNPHDVELMRRRFRASVGNKYRRNL